MKIFILKFFLILSFIFSQNVYASDERHEWYMNFVSNVPETYEDNLNSLVRYLSGPMRNDYDKAQAFAYWIAAHIIYDQYLYQNGAVTKLRKRYENQTPEDLLESRVGICGDFANLFNAMCARAGIKSGYVSGYTFEPGERKSSKRDRDNNAHGWNYFMFGTTKVFVDTTWMAEGKLSVNGAVSSANRRRAIKKNERENKGEVYPVDPYYFDFSYKSEYRDKGIKRIER